MVINVIPPQISNKEPYTVQSAALVLSIFRHRSFSCSPMQTLTSFSLISCPYSLRSVPGSINGPCSVYPRGSVPVWNNLHVLQPVRSSKFFPLPEARTKNNWQLVLLKISSNLSIFPLPILG